MELVDHVTLDCFDRQFINELYYLVLALDKKGRKRNFNAKLVINLKRLNAFNQTKILSNNLLCAFYFNISIEKLNEHFCV